MLDNQGKVVGIVRGTSKERGTNWTRISLVGAFENINGAEGQDAESIFFNRWLDVNVGDIVEVKYKPGWEGKAIPIGIIKLN